MRLVRAGLNEAGAGSGPDLVIVWGASMGKRLYVGNVPFSTTEEELREAFARHGMVTAVDVIMDRETGRPRGFAFVEMDDPAAADAAITALDGQDFGGRNLRVSEAQERRGRR